MYKNEKNSIKLGCTSLNVFYLLLSFQTNHKWFIQTLQEPIMR